MVAISIEYTGDLHCVAKHGPSGEIISTDAPKDNEGKGETFSPTDLLATSLGTCIGTVMGIYARRKGIDLKSMLLEVKKEMTNDPVRRIGRLSVDIHMPISLSEEEREKFLKIAHTCPVHKSLHPDIQTPIIFHWPS